MSILKRKLRLRPVQDPAPEESIQVKEEEEDNSVQTQEKHSYESSPVQNSSTLFVEKRKSDEVKVKLESLSRKESKSSASASAAMKGTKIVRNYAKALCSFAYSDMAVPYLKQIIKNDFGGKISLEDFRKQIKDKKGKTASISSLRALLLQETYDTEKEKVYKKIFMAIAVIFIKFFAVNWIFSGKVKYRLEHLKYRHKMLRRVQNPEYFTYLKST